MHMKLSEQHSERPAGSDNKSSAEVSWLTLGLSGGFFIAFVIVAFCRHRLFVLSSRYRLCHIDQAFRRLLASVVAGYVYDQPIRRAVPFRRGPSRQSRRTGNEHVQVGQHHFVYGVGRRRRLFCGGGTHGTFLITAPLVRCRSGERSGSLSGAGTELYALGIPGLVNIWKSDHNNIHTSALRRRAATKTE